MPFHGRWKGGCDTPPVRSQWGVNLDRSACLIWPGWIPWRKPPTSLLLNVYVFVFVFGGLFFCCWWNLGVGRFCSEDCHCHLLPGSAAGVSSSVGVTLGVAIMPPVACSWAVVVIPIRAASGMLLVSSWRGYMKVPQASCGHTHTTVQKASAKAWHSLSSSAFASWSSTMMLLL